MLFTSPLVLLVVLVMAYYISDKEARGQVIIVALAAICLGAIGLEVEPVQQGAWDLHRLLYPFVVCKWAVIGFGAGWLSLQMIDGVPVKQGLYRSAIFLLLGLFYLTVTVLDRTYSRDVGNDDRKFWTRVFKENQAGYPLSEYRRHLSWEGKKVISYHLQYEQDQLSPELLRQLQNLGVYVGNQRNISLQTMNDLLNIALSNLRTHHPDSPAGYHIAADLARNPNTPPEILFKLNETTSIQVKKAIASNINTPKSLLKSIISEAEKKIDEEMKKPVNQRFYSNYSEIVDKANKSLEAQRQRAGKRMGFGS